MKNKYLILLMLLFNIIFNSNSQVSFKGNSNTLEIIGEGDVKTNNDNARIVNWTVSNNIQFETTVYLKSLDFGKAGIVIRDANSTTNLQKGRPFFYFYLKKPENKLVLDRRDVANGLISNVLEVSNISQGIWLRVVKSGNNLFFKTSLSPETSINSQTWVDIIGIDDAVKNYSNFSRGVIVASGSSLKNKALFTNWKINSVTTSINPPTISSNRNPFVNNVSAVLTSTNCNFTVDWYKNNTYVSSGASLNITLSVTGDVYKAKCKSGVNVSNFSNSLTVIDNNNNSNTNFIFAGVNNLKTVPLETANETFDASKWATIGTKLKPYDATRSIPVLIQVWQHKLKNLHLNNKKWYDLGISFATDKNPQFGGDGRVQCVDWIRYQDPSNGCPWGQVRDVNNNCIGTINNIDPACSGNKTYLTFTSATPFHYRAFADGGTGIPFGSATDAQKYDIGRSYTSSAEYGYGDNDNNRFNNGFVIADIENDFHGSPSEVPVMIGMAESNVGLVANHYGQSINIATPRLSHYPLDYINGGYSTVEKDIDGSVSNNVNNVILGLWNPNYKISIPAKNVVNKGIIDYLNIMECSEVSFFSGSAFKQNEPIYYDGNNPNLFRLTNKFGVNRNAEHPIGHVIYATEVRKWHMRKYFPNHKILTMPKYFVDRGIIGNTNYGGKFGFYIDNTALKAKHFDRKTCLGIKMFTAFNGSHDIYWNRNSESQNQDGVHGFLQGLNLLNQKKNLSQGNLSFVDLFDQWDFKLWTSEISYNGGQTWKQEKGTDYILTSESIPQRQVLTNNGIWAVYLHRNEGIEPTSCKLRVSYNGNFYYLDVTSTMWETVNPTYANTPLDQIPNTDKDFYFAIIDLNNYRSGNPTESTPIGGSTVSAPSIISSPSLPIAGQEVNFTSSGCTGTVKWFLNNVNYTTGNTITVVNPNFGDTYKASCTVGLVESSYSNIISISQNNLPHSNSVTITEPSQPPYYFSDGKQPEYYNLVNNIPLNTPVIHRSGTKNYTDYSGKSVSNIFMQSTYDPVTDIVWIRNDKIKIGLNLKRGGQIAWASLLNDNKNLVYNGYDGGLQVTIDAYQRKNGFRHQPSNKVSRKNYSQILQYNDDANADVNNPLFSYNTTMGGDFNNNSQSLISYKRIGDSYEVKFRPIFYSIDCEWSEVYITAKYTLDNYAVKIEYTYQSFRKDNQFDGGGLDVAVVPACFFVNDLNRYQTYRGSSPFTNAPVENGTIPIQNFGQPILGLQATENFAVAYNPQTNRTIGTYTPLTGNNSQFITLKQLEVYDNNPQGDQYKGGFTYMGVDRNLINIGENINRSNFTKNFTAYLLITDSPTRAREEVYRLRNNN